jgi:acyl-CoA reductase-like NAD-dependent aldehyde dehydrogenase
MGMAGFFRYLSSLDLPMRVIEDTPERRVEAHRRPLGVIGAITPWNYPLVLLSFKLPLSLLAGNTIVIKPAPTTPLSTLKFAELVKDILPKGVINVITDANDLGEEMTKHPDIRKISFTGSTATGQKAITSAAQTLKRITLEFSVSYCILFCNGPSVVPCLDPSSTIAFLAMTTSSSQICS